MVIFTFVLFFFVSNAQIDSSRNIILGLENGFLWYNLKDPVTREQFNLFGLHLAPNIGFCIKDRFLLGVIGEYDSFKSNFTEIEPFKAIGVYGRYYIDFDKRIENPFIKKRFLFYGELSFHKSNNYNGGTEMVVLDKLSESLIRANLGVAFKVWKRFYIESTIRPVYQFNRGFDFTRRFSIEYHF